MYENPGGLTAAPAPAADAHVHKQVSALIMRDFGFDKQTSLRFDALKIQTLYVLISQPS